MPHALGKPTGGPGRAVLMQHPDVIPWWPKTNSRPVPWNPKPSRREAFIEHPSSKRVGSCREGLSKAPY